jgi:hypothetical protein
MPSGRVIFEIVAILIDQLGMEKALQVGDRLVDECAPLRIRVQRLRSPLASWCGRAMSRQQIAHERMTEQTGSGHEWSCTRRGPAMYSTISVLARTPVGKTVARLTGGGPL